MSVMVDRTGELVERSEIDHFGFSVRNVCSAQNQFLVITQAGLRSVKALANRSGLCLMSKGKRLSQSVARKFLITNSKQLEQNKDAKFYRRNYGVSNRIFVQDFREVQQQNLTEMKELQKILSSTFDTLTRQKFIEDQNIAK